MTLKDIISKIDRYCELRILPKIASSGDKWLFFLKLKAFELKLEKDTPAELRGFIDGEGNVDLDLLEEAGRAAFKEVPQASFGNGAFTFREEDLSDFIRVIHGQE